jgi:hypothetical protein
MYDMPKINKIAVHLVFVETMTDMMPQGKRRVAAQFAAAAGWSDLGFSYEELVARAGDHVKRNLMQG